MSRRNHRNIPMHISKTTISYALYLLGLLFVIYVLIDSRNELISQASRANLPLLVISLLLMLAHSLIGCWLLQQFFRAFGARIGYQTTCRVFYLSQVAKYLPGVVWGYSLQASLLAGENSMRKVVFANIRQTILLICTFFFFSLGAMLLSFSFFGFLLALLFAFVSVHLVKHFSLLKLLPSSLTARLPNSIRQDYENLEVSSVMVFIICLLLFLTYLISVSCLISALYEVDATAAARAGLYQCMAWIAGTFAFIVPAGMGVREASFIALGSFNSEFTSDQIQTIAISIRLFQLCLELLFALGASLLLRVKIPRTRKP